MIKFGVTAPSLSAVVLHTLLTSLFPCLCAPPPPTHPHRIIGNLIQRKWTRGLCGSRTTVRNEYPFPFFPPSRQYPHGFLGMGFKASASFATTEHGLWGSQSSFTWEGRYVTLVCLDSVLDAHLTFSVVSVARCFV